MKHGDGKKRCRRTSTKALFDLVSQAPSVGKKNELFGIVIREELEVLRTAGIVGIMDGWRQLSLELSKKPRDAGLKQG